LKPPSFIYAASRAEESEKLAKFASSSETWVSQPGYYADLSARHAGPEVAKSIVDVWLASEFDPAGSSAENVKAIDKLDVVNRNPSEC